MRAYLLAVVLCLACSVSTAAQEFSGDKAQCFTTWDDRFFYLSIKVDCADVSASHKAPNAPITGDDCVMLFIQSDNARTDSPNGSTFRMAVSAAGGAEFSAGSGRGGLEPVTVHTFKYGSSVQGTINNSDDIDTGYMVEMALPWALMGAEPPKFGDMMGFNILVRRNGWKENDFVSLSSRVKTEADVLKPSNWASLVFTTFAFSARPEPDKILSLKNLVRPPVINGRIDEKEWPRNSGFAMDIPLPPGFVYEAKFPIQNLVLAPYYYHWRQSRTVPPAPDSGIVLTDTPESGTGPWFSGDRVGWHKEQAQDAVAAGVDVLLPVYYRDADGSFTSAGTGINRLIAALQELRWEGKPYPTLGMWLDLSSLWNSSGPESAEAGKRALYAAVRDFFSRVPREFRASAQTGKPDPGRMGAVLFVDRSRNGAGLDTETAGYINERFAADFGVPLVWIASEAPAGGSAEFDGIFSLGGSFVVAAPSRIAIATVSPGYDDSAINASGPTVISRLDGRTYEQSWAQAVEARPHWVLCNSWNDYERATEICATREYGRHYIQATKTLSASLFGKKRTRSHYISCSVPECIAPLAIAQAELVIRNAGTDTWKTSEGIALSYRWYKDGRYIGESRLKRGLEKDVAPGETTAVTIGLATVDERGKALPEGRYEARFELVRQADNKWFSTLGDQPLIVPVRVAQPPAQKVGYVSCDCPVLAASGQSYRARLRVRNDGSTVWKKNSVKLGCRLVRRSAGEQSVRPEQAARLMGVLAADCKPGEIATFNISLDFRGPDKKPLAPSPADHTWSYVLVFDIHDGQKWFSEMGIPTIERTVELFESDYGARIIDSSIPNQLAAGQALDVKVVVRNNGVHTWDKKKTRVGYHWYHVDGSPAVWDGIKSPLDADVKPNWPAVVRAAVKAPEQEGSYLLVWDVAVDDVWLSTLPLTRGGDVLVVPVKVTGGGPATLNQNTPK